MNPKPPSPPDAQKFDDVLKEQKVPLRSWRKKYRKMKLRFDKDMEQSNTLWMDCHKLDVLAKRLQEENDQFLETLMHLNETARVPGYDLGLPHEDVVPSEDAVPALDHDHPGPRSLAALLNVPHTALADVDASSWPADMLGDVPPGYLTTTYEEEYLANLDAQLATPEALAADGWWLPQRSRSRILPPEKELLNANPMSVLSWLRRYHPETFIQEKEAAAEKAGKSKGAGGGGGGGGGKRSSMATITSVANTGTPQPHAKEEGEEAEEEWPAEEKAQPSGRGRKTKDDEAYRPKGGSSRPAKRKREEGEKGGRKRARASNAATAATAAAATTTTPG